MDPRDEALYFQNWIYSTVNLSVSGNTKLIVGADPNRVALLFSTDGATGSVSVAPSADTNSPPPFSGFFISNSTAPLLVRFADLGPVVQAAWWFKLYVSTLTHVSVIDVLLKSWPQTPSDIERFAGMMKILGIQPSGNNQ